MLNVYNLIYITYLHTYMSFLQNSKPCQGTHFSAVEGTIVCHDYQEIKIQENVQMLGVGSVPRSIPVVLKDDLVDTVKAGGKCLHFDALVCKI